VHLPPLRDRKEDIPFLIDKFLESAALELGKKKPNVPKQLYTLLSTYDFPGNVRELRGMVFDAMSICGTSTLSMDSFRLKVQKENSVNQGATEEKGAGLDRKVQFSGTLPTLREIQDLLIEEALKAADGNQTIASGILGMSRRALNNRLSRK
jgi:DNA-binding NtrC family response regulator